MFILHDHNKLKEITRGDLQNLLANPQNLNSYAYAVNNPVIMKDDDGNFAFLVFIAIAYIAAEIGFSAWDARDAGNAWFGENTSNSNKAWAGGGLVAGLALPGPGKVYKSVGENLVSRVAKDIHWNQGADVVLDHFKRHSKALTERTGKIFNNAMEYSTQAKDFVVKSGDNFKYFFDNVENAWVKWDTKTHEFLATTKFGNIKTYFVRDNLDATRFIEKTAKEFEEIIK